METKHKVSSTALELVLLATKNNNGASFTIRSKNTGKDYTYKIKRSVFKNIFYTHIFVETGYLNFNHIGTYFKGSLWAKKQPVQTPSAIAISWILANVELKKFAFLDEKIDLFHLGSCLRCGKVLTDAQSIEIGLGPICRTLNGLIG